jgi:hypothetical protein
MYSRRRRLLRLRVSRLQRLRAGTLRYARWRDKYHPHLAAAQVRLLGEFGEGVIDYACRLWPARRLPEWYMLREMEGQYSAYNMRFLHTLPRGYRVLSGMQGIVQVTGKKET